MSTAAATFFHKMYGPRNPRVHYYAKDFLDYTIMVAISAVIIGLTYGLRHFMALTGFALCAVMVAVFAIRHGVEWRVPVIVRRPQDLLYMFVYKLGNLKPVWFIALGLLLLENVAIEVTPSLPHHVDFMRRAALVLFYAHLLIITGYRTAILVDHLRKKELVREVLMQTAWKRVVHEKTNITLEIVHAYVTGLLTHIILLAPWYLVITHFKFSVIFMPVVAVINLAVEWYWLRAHNAWFYRDHWLGHNSELEFVLLHGTHHDAIPSGLIGVAEHGFLEGFLRGTLAFPDPFFNPLVAFLVYTGIVKRNIDAHQYIPGVFPKMPKGVMRIVQHSTHHFGSLEPYSFGLKVDQPGISEAFKKSVKLPEELANSILLDEELNGFRWDNPTYQRTLALYEKYQN
jgi:hypothetical protein